jgi:hypothetical protein
MRSRRRWLRQPLSWKRGGAASLIILALVIAAALYLDAGTAAELEPVEAYVRERGRPPVEVVEAAGRTARIVLLSDVAGHAAPKRLVAEAIRALAEGPGLDAVVLEVPSTEQPFIDTYLTRAEENATLLLARPAAVRQHEGLSRDYLEIYRAVWRVNQEVGAARRLRIIAADHPAWPPPEGASPQDIARLHGQRARHMLEHLDEQLLALMPDARLLVFVDGYLALQRTHGQLRFAGGDAARVEWLGELLRERAAADTRTVLVDVPVQPGAVRRLPEYHGTRFFRPLRRAVDRSVGVRIDDTFAGVRSPVLESSSPGLRLEIGPAGYTLREVADYYILLRGAR